MEREHWIDLVRIVELTVRQACPVRNPRHTFTWSEILLVHFWCVQHNRPAEWACDQRHWPADLRPAQLPTPSTLCRRKQQALFNDLLARIARHQQRGRPRGLLWQIDGKPLPVSRHSRDRFATCGRGAGGMAKGYKLHLIRGENRGPEFWRVTPLHVDERVMARRLARQLSGGYLLADGFYDDNRLHAICSARGVQLVAPRRRPGTQLGHGRHHPQRLRSRDMLEQSLTGFGPQLHRQRAGIERYFGTLSCANWGLTHLPAWVRTLRRVRQWVAAKLIIFETVRRMRKCEA